MKNADGKVIYVGKSKALKNRVSQYFQSGNGHNLKTSRMVANVRSYDYILCDSEIEALALENKLIKLYTPRYNIRLKDGKSYPYIRMEGGKDNFPYLTVTRSRKKDGASYFGPYSGMKTAYGILEALKRALGLPTCKYRFPKDKGKVRPCIYYQMGQCVAPCIEEGSEQYSEISARISSFLRGHIGKTKADLKEQMTFAAQNLRFEWAASLRDRLKALDRLTDKQKVVGAPGEDFDVIALYEGEDAACLCVMYVRDGSVFDSEYQMLGADSILDGDAVSSALVEIYSCREDIPHFLYLDYPLAEEEQVAFEQYFLEFGKKLKLHIPERGEKKQLCLLARDNAADHAEKESKKEEKTARSLLRLASLLGLDAPPLRIESVDISGYGNEQIVAGYIVFENGVPCKKDYRIYKMKETVGQDDYASMYEAMKRRLAHKDEWQLPDLVLLDGGKGQVGVIKRLFEEQGITTPLFGMVKDDFHKTRAITDGTREISIANEQAVYMLVYNIQEEVHRFASGAALKGKRKTMRRSSLEDIPGIGAAKAKTLLSMKGGLSAVKKATAEELAILKGISAKDAEAVYTYFHK